MRCGYKNVQTCARMLFFCSATAAGEHRELLSSFRTLVVYELNIFSPPFVSCVL
jgi:hypothetical protein